MNNKTMDLVACLREVRRRIEKPQNWTRFKMARLSNGRDCNVIDPNAVRWCLMGCVMTLDEKHYFRAKNAIESALGTDDWGHQKSITLFNDTHHHSDVMELIDKAIARLEAQL